MNKLISTKFFRTLREASQTGIDADAKELKTGYDEFVKFLFFEDKAVPDRAVYRQKLLCTRVELSILTLVSKKKSGYLSCKGCLSY